LSLLTEQWHDVVARAGKMSPLARSALIDAKPIGVAKGVVTIGFDPEFVGNRVTLQHPRNMTAVERALSDVLSTKVRVRFDELDPNVTLPGDTKFEREEEDGVTAPRKTDPEAKRGAAITMRDKWVSDPSVAKMLETFNGDIIDIRE
jgi:hypothetical protein